MKAVVLAAGKGERLRPITNSVPKCMVTIAGVPVLERNIAWLREHGVSELAINLHHLPHVVQSHFSDGRRFGVSIKYLLEPVLLGTAGTVTALKSWLASEENFLVIYGDNLLQCDLHRFLQQHRESDAMITLAVYWRDDVSASGVVDLEGDQVVRFIEKPRGGVSTSHWVNAGLLACRSELFQWLRRPPPVDFGRHVLPELADSSRVQGYRMGGGEWLLWIDRPEDLAHSERAFLTHTGGG